jgi:hypothetical protein
MLTEDYLMRMISLAVAALVRILLLRKAGQTQDALQEIDQAIEQLTGLRRELLPHLDDKQLINALTIQGSLDVDRLSLVADLYEQQGEVFADIGQLNLSEQSFARALNFNLEIAFNSEDPLSQAEKIDSLRIRLKGTTLPAELVFTLFSYEEMIGRYAQAEQTLRQLMLDSKQVQFSATYEQTREEYIDYCQRLLELPDATLNSGGLTRQQVEIYLDHTLHPT